MYLTARLYIADVMDQVVIQATLWPLDGPELEPQAPITFCATVPGVGETKPDVWLSDALVALLETM